jgi:hypothetical protein
MKELVAKTGKDRTKERTRRLLIAPASVLVLGGIGLLDHLTGPEISFGVFYFLPIWMMTWHLGRRPAVLFSVLCALVWLVVDETDGGAPSSPWIPFWNAGARLVYFLTFALLLSGTREKLQASRREAKRLSSLLPICAECKKIRDDQGQWHEVEAYIRDHSDTSFSHGICPDCTKKLYPEYSTELLKKWGKKRGPQ